MAANWASQLKPAPSAALEMNHDAMALNQE
jgi:hypothetical protein